MSIHSIGGNKPGAPALTPEGALTPSTQAAASDAPFELNASGAEASAEVLKPNALERLKAGEISLDEYLDSQVELATSHLKSSLGPEEFAFIQESLKGDLRTDPSLIELTRRATGLTPEFSPQNSNE